MSGTGPTPIAGAETQGVPAGTPLPESQQPPAASSTQTPSDANGQPPVQQPAQDYASKRDLDRMRSVFQQQQAQQAAQFRQREAQLQQEVDAARTRGMDDTQRQAYEHQRLAEAHNALINDYRNLQGYIQQDQTAREYADYFRARGVTDEQLAYDGDIQGLLVRGWAAVDARLQGGGQQQQASRQPMQAPAVVTNTGAVAPANSWASLRAEYKGMSDEDIYRAVEQGQIDPRKIPIPPEA